MTDSDSSYRAFADALRPLAGLDNGYSGDVAARRPRPAFVEQFVGIVRSSPCSSRGSDYTDARYSIDRAIAKQPSTGALAADVDSIPGLRQCLTAVNLAELADGTHLLPAGTLVQVFALIARTTSRKIYVFHQPPPQAVVVSITSAATGAGQYNGRILNGAASASPATNLAMPAGMTAPAADNALVLNVEEDGATGHRLQAGTYAVGAVRGATTESPPRRIVLIRGALGATSGATTLGSSAEGSETADSASWSRASNATPLNLYIVTRMVYNEAGDKALYQFVRQLSFDARGLLLSAGAETRVLIDATESCP